MRAAITYAQTHTHTLHYAMQHTSDSTYMSTQCLRRITAILANCRHPDGCLGSWPSSVQCSPAKLVPDYSILYTIHQHPLDHSTHINGLPSNVHTIPTHACPNINGHTAPLAYHTHLRYMEQINIRNYTGTRNPNTEPSSLKQTGAYVESHALRQ